MREIIKQIEKTLKENDKVIKEVKKEMKDIKIKSELNMERLWELL